MNGRCLRLLLSVLVTLIVVRGGPEGWLAPPPLVAADNFSSLSLDTSALNVDIPTPASVIGHEVGARAVRYDALLRYLTALSEASPRVVLTEYGESYEGRKLLHLIVTSPENHQRLDQIQADNAKLTDPRQLASEAEADRIVAEMPAVAWMAYSIHGDELSPTDAAMQAAYQLAAGTDEATKAMLDELIIHIIPLQNPDGRERHLSSIEQRTGAVSSTDGQHIQHNALGGRTNHYRFDLNRDWLMLSQQENRAHAAQFHAWNPHLLIDAHEMGPEEGYLMDPPRQPLNPAHPPHNLPWRQQFGFDQAAAFDRHGWSYYAKDWNVEFAPIYTSSWTNLAGGVGLLYEQAGVSAAAYRQATGQDLTYREAVHHQLVSTFANLETLRAQRKNLLQAYLDDHRKAVADDVDFYQTFVMPPPADTSRYRRFIEAIQRQGVEFSFADAPFRGEGVTSVYRERIATREFPRGSLIVRPNQPQRRVMQALLGFENRADEAFLLEEREELENHGGSRFYDVTAWNFPMTFGLESYWCDRIGDVPTSETAPASAQRVAWEKTPQYGYLLDARSADIYPLLWRLWQHDVQARVATKPFRLGSQDFAAGTILLRNHEQQAPPGPTLQTCLENLDVAVYPVDTASVGQRGPDLGGPKFQLLHAPRVAIDASRMSYAFGAVWHLLDQRLRMRVTPVDGIGDLRKYNVLILPDSGWSNAAELRRWVEAGGTLIAFASSAINIAKEDAGLSDVRLRRDVLDSQHVYARDLLRERASTDVEIDFADLWGDAPPSEAADIADDIEDDSHDLETLQRNDAWQRRFRPSGVFLRAQLDPRHWIGFGLESPLPVFFRGSHVLMAKHPTDVPVRLAPEAQLRLSGLLWPEARRRLADGAFVTVEPLGEGQLILFAGNPVFRGWLAGGERLMLNAIMLGPGVGASQSLPW